MNSNREFSLHFPPRKLYIAKKYRWVFREREMHCKYEEVRERVRFGWLSSKPITFFQRFLMKDWNASLEPQNLRFTPLFFPFIFFPFVIIFSSPLYFLSCTVTLLIQCSIKYAFKIKGLVTIASSFSLIGIVLDAYSTCSCAVDPLNPLVTCGMCHNPEITPLPYMIQLFDYYLIAYPIIGFGKATK